MIFNFRLLLLLFNIFVIYGKNTIKTISPCIGELGDGRRIDLTSLAAENTFKWKMKALQPVGDSHWYYYNPCKPFNLGGSCPDNAVCQATNDEKTNYDLGRQDDSVLFSLSEDDIVGMVYTANDKQRVTAVACYCTKTKTPTFKVIGTTNTGNLATYLMNLNSTCCCPDGCTKSGSSGLSGGSILLIIVFSLLFVYIVVGILFNYFKSKTLNTELIPNVNFWKEQPQNIKTGVVFVIGKLRPKSSGYSNL